jgi:hypothetical protein
MDSLVDIPVLALAVAMLAAGVWGTLTRTRVKAWFATAALLWLATASFIASAKLGTPSALLALGWTFTAAGLLVAIHAASGRSWALGARASSAPALEISHVANTR